MAPNTHFKEIRKKLGLTQSDLAVKIGVSQGTITDIERGRIGISKKVATLMLNKFGILQGDLYPSNTEKSIGAMQGTNAGFLQDAFAGVNFSDKNAVLNILNELKNDKDWEKAFTIQNQILINNNEALEGFKDVLHSYWQQHKTLFQFIHQYAVFFSSEIQNEIFRSLKNGKSADQITSEYQALIQNLKPLKAIYKKFNSQLSELIEQLEKFDNQGLMKESIDDYVLKEEFEKAAPLRNMHSIPQNFRL